MLMRKAAEHEAANATCADAVATGSRAFDIRCTCALTVVLTHSDAWIPDQRSDRQGTGQVHAQCPGCAVMALSGPGFWDD